MRRTLLGLALSAGVVVPSPVAAQTRSPDPAIEVVAATRGMSKGLAQTEGPQLVLRGELGFGDLFVAAYGKNVVSSGDEGVEAGALAGVRFGGAGFQLAASAAYKRLVGMSGPADDDALEFVLSASRRMNRVTVRAAVIWSPDELGSTGRSAYFEAGLSVALGQGTSLSGNLGRRERSGGSDYTSFNLGVTQNLLPGVSADLRLYDTAESNFGEPYRRRLVASLRARF